MVLVVDDNLDTADYLARMLKASGLSAHAVHDGMSALKAIECDKPAVVILDLMMPGMSGIEVLKIVRAHAQTKDLPVVIYSADWLMAHDKELADLGISDFIPKASHDFHRLLSVVKKLDAN